MPRDLVFGNGRLLVCVDRHLFVRDLYWPRVGLYNHLSGNAIRFGVWAEGRGFAWIDESWDRTLEYRPNSLVGACRLKSDALAIELTVEDAVDYRADIWLRRVVVRNTEQRERAVRVYLAPNLDICETNIGDTTYWDPYAHAVVHYKRDNTFLFGGSNLTGWACGMKGLAGMEGTWHDCEDGELSGNTIAQGSVDSAIEVSVSVPGGGEATADLWLCVGKTREAVIDLQTSLNPDELLRSTDGYWRAWATSGDPAGLDTLPPRVRSLFRQSLLLIRTQIDNGGAILAANDTDIMQGNRAHYSYLWPRDGALVARALDRAGYGELTRRFFEFCRSVLPESRPALMHKYGPDGSVGSSWHAWLDPDGNPEAPLQEDETALVIWSLWHHYEKHRDFSWAEEMYRTFTRPCADFLLKFRDPETGLPLPSWDLWEERRGVHTYTVCATIAALDAATNFGLLFGDETSAARFAEGASRMRDALVRHLFHEDDRRFARRLECHAGGGRSLDRTQDASLHALYLFDVFPPDDWRVQETMRQVNQRLWVNAGMGGMARYEGDYYARVADDLHNVPGNPWIICTLWRAQWIIASAQSLADLEAASDLLEWCCLCALPSGVLPEQIHPYTFQPMTVAPLTWSHSEVVETVFRLLEKRATLS